MADERDSRRQDEQRQRKVDKRVDHWGTKVLILVPVSYTHLDVYKRQILLNRFNILSSETHGKMFLHNLEFWGVLLNSLC